MESELKLRDRSTLAAPLNRKLPAGKPDPVRFGESDDEIKASTSHIAHFAWGWRTSCSCLHPGPGTAPQPNRDPVCHGRIQQYPRE
jgi:hypothetical protein